jgi:plastocyanin
VNGQYQGAKQSPHERKWDMSDNARRLDKVRKPVTLLAALAAAATMAMVPTLAFGGARPASGHTVVLKEIGFHPATLNIRRGDSVTWLWRDGGVEHNVTAAGFHSRTQGRGSYTVKFTRRGTFSYRCTIHVALGMRGKIVVH